MSLQKNDKKNKGILEVICGPMFSGKTEELIRRLRRAKFAQQNIIIFKHSLDNRDTIYQVVSHNGNRLNAQAVENSQEILKYVQGEIIDVIGIDEIHFFSKELVPVIIKLVTLGKRVIAAGLDLDFRGIPFDHVATLLAFADFATKLQAICMICGDDAPLTQRLINGQPAKAHDPIIVVGAQEIYQARCRACHAIDQAPLFKWIQRQDSIEI